MAESATSRWMRHLAEHHARCRETAAGERLLVVFDIDVTDLLEAHRPHAGVMEVIRWFQLQPSTSVGVTTGRPESLRTATLRSLNALGRAHRVHFDDALLQMHPGGSRGDRTATRADGLRAFAAAGYRVVAVVADEPGTGAGAEAAGDVLFVQAPIPAAGDVYPLRSLIPESALPRHVQLVWHGVNDLANRRQFLASPVHWGEVDVRRDPRGELVLRHDPFPTPPDGVVEPPSRLDDCLDAFRTAGRGVKLDLKDATTIDDVLRHVRRSGLHDADLWFNGRVDTLGEHTFRRIVAEHPRAVVQCPVDLLGPVAATEPDEAKQLVEAMTHRGVNRFSVSWSNPHARLLLDRLDEWGHEVNIYAVPDLEQFLRAVLLLPRSITADFNFPEWHYFGRGSGQRGLYHRYQLATSLTPTTDVA